MSLEIEVDAITSVLLTDGRWYRAVDFCLDAYEYVDFLVGGQDRRVSATGFQFRQPGSKGWITGPLTSIVAVVRE
ncbi:hypothetical protein SEA_TRAX_68 [Gordonia phage Trax]|uniref:Uncharacterized protein n=1 Tax=Gordonia phage Trax TaxID=2591121 RepID=A0A515MH05_9CAUD|nr:hypothetical protein L3Y20_gp068 [Gordonia phage Trax]QDM55955.1 hypothetical protein SEA_TRAX_68 [Gordonia phage Trax]